MSIIGNPILLLNQAPSYLLEPFGTTSDDNFVKLIKAAHQGKISLIDDARWAVGDKRTISISSFTGVSVHPAQSIDIVLSSFFDYENCGCVMQFDFAKCIYDYGDPIGTPGTGYRLSTMRRDILPALVRALPEYLKNLLLPFSCKASEGNQSTTIETIPNNYLALRSEVEIFGTNTYSAVGEGSQLLYYTTTTRQKKSGKSNQNVPWWTRSPSIQNSENFIIVDQYGFLNTMQSNKSRGLAPFGCI